jgi:hypothetical protein
MKIDGVYVPGEGYCRTYPGTEVTKILAFAGKGTETGFRRAQLLSDMYGGQPENWQKVRGEVVLIRDDGMRRRAELHWAYEWAIGVVELKFKGWRDKEWFK